MRIAVVSPFLDRRHGTELCLIEQLERLSSSFGCSIDLYSQRVEDLRLSPPQPGDSSSTSSHGSIAWHRISDVPGPHLLKYCWWFLANALERKHAKRDSSLRPDITFSPGINCFDADAILVHIVFHDFYARVRERLRLSRIPLRQWPLAIHRRLYYRLIMLLERQIYSNPRIRLAAVSHWVAEQLRLHFGRTDVTVIPNAVDTERFSMDKRLARRAAERERFGVSEDEIVLLLIGNDWKKKGLDQLLAAIAELRDLPLRLIVAGRDDKSLYEPILHTLGLQQRVVFAESSADVLAFYAAADIYVGPSLEDAFGLPIIEAMACGLPVIASQRAGASELIINARTGFLLKDPEDPAQLVSLIRNLIADEVLRAKIGQAAAAAMAQHSWETNAAQLLAFLKSTRQV